ncbi:hypothetical protein FOYG_12955 [Fusarium oxysporum NRRL 32931]|uniref:Uncharacterized protein n=1 Tax=Fusarium oxysporum NRRL 32931 TaxID=660029 RepID=W9I046_FUSOX|nr:hypothetical protein FOYG_12955 [Fusarium oxysporum NRRL 32931]
MRRDFPMAQYAAVFWMDFAVSAEASEEIVRSTVNFLRDETTFQLWCHLYQADRLWYSRTRRPRAFGLYYAYLGGLVEAARILITKGADINAQGGTYGNALQAALSRGNLEAV